MTLTFNRDRYRELLFRYQPKPIRTESENEKALALIAELSQKGDRSAEEEELYELLLALVERFERGRYRPARDSDPRSLLRSLMGQRGLKQADLVGIIGSKGVVSEVVNGKRGISKAQAKALGEFFQVEPGLFL
jgi:HTH-type transcriptional regulator/antitoxin HigA